MRHGHGWPLPELLEGACPGRHCSFAQYAERPTWVNFECQIDGPPTRLHNSPVDSKTIGATQLPKPKKTQHSEGVRPAAKLDKLALEDSGLRQESTDYHATLAHLDSVFNSMDDVFESVESATVEEFRETRIAAEQGDASVDLPVSRRLDGIQPGILNHFLPL